MTNKLKHTFIFIKREKSYNHNHNQPTPKFFFFLIHSNIITLQFEQYCLRDSKQSRRIEFKKSFKTVNVIKQLHRCPLVILFV